MASTATRAYGTILQKVSGTSETNIAQVRDISGPNGEADDIDISNMDSPTMTREFIKGMIDQGEVTFDLVYVKGQYSTLQGYLVSTVTNDTWQIELPDRTNTSGTGSLIVFPGYLKSLGAEAPFEDKVGATASFKVAGAITFTPSS